MKNRTPLALTLLFFFALGGCATKAVKTTPAPGAPLIVPSVGKLGGPRINDELSYRQIAPHTYVVTDETFFNSNVLVAWMGDDTVLTASSPFETEGATALVEWIRKKFGPAKLIVINTHFHSDGTGGNEAFIKAEAQIWASEMTKKLQISKGAAVRKESMASFTDPKLRQRIESRREVMAQNIFDPAKGLQLEFKGEPVTVFYPGPAHSPDNVVVYLPQRQVLFGGCMIRSGDSTDLGFLGSADVEHWETSARTLLNFPVKFVIPGHGAVGGSELIQNTIDLAAKARIAPPIK